MVFFISHEHVLKIKRPLIEHNYNGISNTLEIPCIEYEYRYSVFQLEIFKLKSKQNI